MKNKTVYIAGRITGQRRDIAWAKFQLAEDKLSSLGYETIYNPMKLGVDLENTHTQNQLAKPTWEDYMNHDMIFLLNSKVVVALEDWRTSNGASVELFIAKSFGKEVINEDGTEFTTAFELKKH